MNVLHTPDVAGKPSPSIGALSGVNGNGEATGFGVGRQIEGGVIENSGRGGERGAISTASHVPFVTPVFKVLQYFFATHILDCNNTLHATIKSISVATTSVLTDPGTRGSAPVIDPAQTTMPLSQ